MVCSIAAGPGRTTWMLRLRIWHIACEGRLVDMAPRASSDMEPRCAGRSRARPQARFPPRDSPGRRVVEPRKAGAAGVGAPGEDRGRDARTSSAVRADRYFSREEERTPRESITPRSAKCLLRLAGHPVRRHRELAGTNWKCADVAGGRVLILLFRSPVRRAHPAGVRIQAAGDFRSRRGHLICRRGSRPSATSRAERAAYSYWYGKRRGVFTARLRDELTP